MIGIVYGSKPAECIGSNCGTSTGVGVVSIFNSMNFAGGVAILPAANFSNTPIGAVIDQSFYLIPRIGLTLESIKAITDSVETVPSMKLYLTSADISSTDLELHQIIDQIKALNSLAGVRTDHLVEVVK